MIKPVSILNLVSEHWYPDAEGAWFYNPVGYPAGTGLRMVFPPVAREQEMRLRIDGIDKGAIPYTGDGSFTTGFTDTIGDRWLAANLLRMVNSINRS